jgi:hypothetical protein
VSPRGLTQLEDAGQVGLQHLVPVGQGELDRGRAPNHAGVVDQDIDATQASHGLFDKPRAEALGQAS